jgi:O-methyltransferase involved in polyketide biosynthesis
VIGSTAIAPPPSKSPGDLTVTALYTSQVWQWAGFDKAELFATEQGRAVFRVTNAVLDLVRLVRRNIPSLRHGLAQRHAIIDGLWARSRASQVLELAAGLSQRGAAVSSDTRVHYTEVDLPPVIDIKRQLMERSEPGREVSARANFGLIAADVNDAALPDLVDGDRGVFVIAEGLLMYLDAAEQRQLWRRAADLVRRHPASELVFDLVPACEQPPPGLIGRGLEVVFKRFTEGKSFAFDGRTRADLRAELAACGFDLVDLLEPGSLGSDWTVPFRDHHTQVLVWRCRCTTR